jgi:CubicO group peptidase (beta-lactamase class C family)
LLLKVRNPSMMDASAPITTLVLDLDALAANVMAEWHIPGLALAVLRRDAPPLLQAFGFTDIEGRTRVETTTLFPIGSITKSFTATGLGLLVDEGKLGWDVPVREILAEFKLKDPRRKRKVHPARPADPPHRPAAPRLGSHARASRQCRRAGSVASPRSEPGIPQRLPNTRTLCIWWQAWWRSASPGNPWEDFIRARILDPLGMANTTTSLEEMVSEHTNHGAPHVFQENVLSRMPVRPIHTRPSGSIRASITDSVLFAVSSRPDRGSGRPAVVGGRCDPAHGATDVR